jgi:hypothetical protein
MEIEVHHESMEKRRLLVGVSKEPEIWKVRIGPGPLLSKFGSLDSAVKGAVDIINQARAPLTVIVTDLKEQVKR